MSNHQRLSLWAAAFLFVVLTASLHVRGLLLAPHIGASWTRTPEGYFLITGVDHEGPARTGGITSGDLVIAVGERTADPSVILTNETLPIGVSTTLTVLRGESELRLKLTPINSWVVFKAAATMRLMIAFIVVVVSWLAWAASRWSREMDVLLGYAHIAAVGLNGHLLFSSTPGAVASAGMLLTMPFSASMVLELFNRLVLPIDRLWLTRLHVFGLLTGLVATVAHIIRFFHPSEETRSWWGAAIGFEFIFISACQMFVLWRIFRAALSPEVDRISLTLFALAMVGTMVPYMHPSFFQVETSTSNVLLTMAPLISVTVFSILIRRK